MRFTRTLQHQRFLLLGQSERRWASGLNDNGWLGLQIDASSGLVFSCQPPSAHSSLHTGKYRRVHSNRIILMTRRCFWKNSVTRVIQQQLLLRKLKHESQKFSPKDLMLISAVILASASSSSWVRGRSRWAPLRRRGASCRSCRRRFVFLVCSLVDCRTDFRAKEYKTRQELKYKAEFDFTNLQRCDVSFLVRLKC